jgi:cellulose synthase/poly-beta-1,6-N-acetylglucosamine synthase-like glycosyltransferase
MTFPLWVALALSLLLLPVLLTCIDAIPALRAARGNSLAVGEWLENDFEILVPIYGSLRYLENINYLENYASQVILCTTDAESPEFDKGIDELSRRYGFRVFRAHVPGGSSRSGRRSTGGVIRDIVVRDALSIVTAQYVVCVDADTVTDRPLTELVGAMAHHRLDVASVRLYPSNPESALGRLQSHEYRMSMRLRDVVPWLVSGACHAARTSAFREIMARHSLFFQGNDVETGMLADLLGFRVGHLPFPVPTAVPVRIGAWVRQRLAWAGGEFRLYVVNIRLARRHPVFYIYGAIVVIVGVPFRWLSITELGWALVVIPLLYLALVFVIEKGHRDIWLLALPLYAAFLCLVMTPLGVVWYAKMAMSAKNAGLISLKPTRTGAVALGGLTALPTGARIRSGRRRPKHASGRRGSSRPGHRSVRA